MVYGALDGVVTTLAVIAGASGAQLAPRVGLILGLANLLADGVSMGASNYLGLKTELRQTGASEAIEQPWRHGLATTAAFVVFGAVPLLAFLPGFANGDHILRLATTLAVVAFVVLGTLRSRYVQRGPLRSTVEVLAIGFAAAATAYGVGAVADRLTR